MPGKPDPSTMIITGSSRGIGRGIAEYFLAQGYLVAGCSRGNGTIKHGRYLHAIVDVGDEIQVREWVRSIRNTFPRIDVLVCNAGLAPAALLLTMTSGEVLNAVMRTNVAGTFYVCREVARAMMLQRSGRILTVSSMATGLHAEGTSAYSASKSAITEITRVLAKELASSGVTCNVVAPSMITTGAVEALGDTVTARALDKLTIKRRLTIEEICNVVSFFAGPQAGCITGQVLYMGLVS